VKHVVEAGDIEEAMRAAAAVGDDRLQYRSRGYVVPIHLLTARPNNASAGFAAATRRATSARATHLTRVSCNTADAVL
jgi:hypothetical protein